VYIVCQLSYLSPQLQAATCSLNQTIMRMNNVFHRWEWSSVPRNRSHQPSLLQNQRCLSSTRPELLGARLAPTSIYYHRNVWVLILIKNWLALTILWAAGPRMLRWNKHGRVVWKFGIIWVEKAQITARERFGPLAPHWSKFITGKFAGKAQRFKNNFKWKYGNLELLSLQCLQVCLPNELTPITNAQNTEA